MPEPTEKPQEDFPPLVAQPAVNAMAGMSQEDIQYLLCLDFQIWCQSFAYFKGKTGAVKQGMAPNILQLRVIDHYRRCQHLGKPCLIMILKPRQKGASTIAEAICYHHMRRYPNLNGVLMGDVQATSDKVFEMFRRYAQHDTFPWRDGGGKNIAPGGDLADEITLINGSKWWKETAGSTNAGRSGTVQALHMDEVAYFPNTSSKDPTTAVLGSFYKESPQSLGFATSTANGCSGWYHDTWHGDNDWFKVFAAWYEFDDSVKPFASEEEKNAFIRSMTEDEIQEKKLYPVSYEQLNWRRSMIRTDYKGDVGKFKQEFPSSADSAFLSSSRMRFDEVALGNMMAFTKTNDSREYGNFIIQEGGVATWIPDPRGSWARWEPAIPGCRYLISADTCSGRDQQIGGTTSDPDWHSAQVIRGEYMDQGGKHHPPAVVAEHHSREDTDILAEIIAGAASYFGNCLVVPEVNGSGGLHIVKELTKYGCNVYRRSQHTTHRKAQTEEEVLQAFGWQTDKLTRKWIIDALAPLIRMEGITIYGKEIIEELQSFIVTANGNSEAAPSKHDDRVLALAIGVFNLGAATEYKIRQSNPMSMRKLQRDPHYMAPDGFVRVLPRRR